MAKTQKTLKNLSELKKAIKTIPLADLRDAGECLFAEISFLHTTLEKLKSNVNTYGVTFSSPTGARENPSLKAYNVSIMRYSQLIKQLTDMLPKTIKEEPDKFLNFIENPEL